MTRLSDFRSDVYSQFGEAGCIDECVRRLPDVGNWCVEFGASDGLSCSNTAHLWRERGWRAVLIEADPVLAGECFANTVGLKNVTVINATVSASNPDHSIDAILAANSVAGQIDVMSVDIDGDDFYVVTGMTVRPRLLIVEFNPTVPPHLSILPAGPGQRFGVGIATLKQALEWRGWAFIGCTAVNAFFVQASDAHLFADLETDLSVLFPPERFTYLATDEQGRMVPIGAVPPHGLVWPPSETRWASNQPALLTVDATDPTERLMLQVLAEIRDLREVVEGKP